MNTNDTSKANSFEVISPLEEDFVPSSILWPLPPPLLLWNDFDITTPSIPFTIYSSLSIPSALSPVSLWDDSTITITGIPDTIHSLLSFPSALPSSTECDQFLLANVVKSFDDDLFEPTMISLQQPRTSSPPSIPPSIASMLSDFKSSQSKSPSASASPTIY